MLDRQNADNDWRSRVPAAIDRLRESKTEFDTDEEANGKREGREWALDVADFGDLKKLEAAGSVDTLDELLSAFAHQGAGRDFFFGDPAYDEDPDVSDARIRGFVAGALEVWEEIREQL